MTVPQVTDALQVLLEARIQGRTRSQLRDLADDLAEQILETQDRNRRARESACRRRIASYAKMGINPGRLRPRAVHALTL